MPELKQHAIFRLQFTTGKAQRVDIIYEGGYTNAVLEAALAEAQPGHLTSIKLIKVEERLAGMTEEVTDDQAGNTGDGGYFAAPPGTDHTDH